MKKCVTFYARRAICTFRSNEKPGCLHHLFERFTSSTGCVNAGTFSALSLPLGSIFLILRFSQTLNITPCAKFYVLDNIFASSLAAAAVTIEPPIKLTHIPADTA
jgi:hypothetical protein